MSDRLPVKPLRTGSRLRGWIVGMSFAGLALVGSGLLALAAAPAHPRVAAPSRLEYVLSPFMENGALRGLDFTLEFRGDADGETILLLPQSTGAGNVVVNLSASGADLKEGAHPRERVLRHRPNARIQISWRLVHDWPDAPTGLQSDPYRPVIQSDYFQVTGPSVMIVPRVDDATPLRFRMQGFPSAWSLASDLEHPDLTLKQLQLFVIVGGDYRVARGARDPNLRLAIRGAWTFQDEDLLRTLEAIFEGQRRFWGDPSTPYLVAFTPFRDNTIVGTALEDAFTVFSTPTVDVRRLTRLLAHETFHTWLPLQLGGLPDVDEAAGYWFSEGFTNFFAPRLLVRDGIWSVREFVDDLNEVLRAYAASPERSAPNTRIVEARQSDRRVEVLPYQRGRLFATLIDARLRGRGRDLDDVVLEMRRRAPTAGMVAPGLFAAVMADMDMPIDEDVRVFIERGDPIMLPDDAFAPCGTLVTRGVEQQLMLEQDLEGARAAACLRVLGGA